MNALRSPRRVLWLLVALAACGSLLAVLVRRYNTMQTRSNVFLTGDPKTGVQLFESKGCVHCHAVNGWGGRLAPDLGLQWPPESSASELAAGMWNCAPRMWESMRAEGIAYPAVSQVEMADLFAFLYTTRYLDEPGNARQGQLLFTTKGCARCHAVRGVASKIGPDVSAMAGVDTPIVWSETMWNHAPVMEAAMQELGLAWPRFQDREMNDLLAYVREVGSGVRRESQLLPADPKRGKNLFRSKSCTACHSVRGEGGRLGPELSPQDRRPLTLVQFAGLMWNHSPDMWRASKAQNIPRPTFEANEMADLLAFLWSLRYFEPAGSRQVGESLFAKRNCHRCHGSRAEGTPRGPALRRRAKTYSLVGFATMVWRHGPKMYQRARELGVPWPTLGESELGDLLSFLNSSVQNAGQTVSPLNRSGVATAAESDPEDLRTAGHR